MGWGHPSPSPSPGLGSPTDFRSTSSVCTPSWAPSPFTPPSVAHVRCYLCRCWTKLDFEPWTNPKFLFPVQPRSPAGFSARQPVFLPTLELSSHEVSLGGRGAAYPPDNNSGYSLSTPPALDTIPSVLVHKTSPMKGTLSV